MKLSFPATLNKLSRGLGTCFLVICAACNNPLPSPRLPTAGLEVAGKPLILELAARENAYSSSVLAPLAGLQRRLFREFLERQPNRSLSRAIRIDGYCYFSRQEPGAKHPQHLRYPCRHNLDGAPQPGGTVETILDLNRWPGLPPGTQAGSLRISPGHNQAAFTLTDSLGSFSSLFVKEISASGPELISPGPVDSCQWANDGATIYYTIMQNERAYRLYRHTLQAEEKDELLFEEPDPASHLSLSRSEDGNFILLDSHTQTTSDVYWLDAHIGKPELNQAQPKRQGVRYSIHPRGNELFVLSNEGAADFKIIRRRLQDAPSAAPVMLYAGAPDSALVEIMVFKDFLALLERKNGNPHIGAFDLNTWEFFDILAPAEPCQLNLPAGSDFGLNRLHFSQSCFTLPKTVYEYDLKTRKSRVIFQERVEALPAQWPQDYLSRKLYAPTKDGALIPISLLMKKTPAEAFPRPLLLYVYGAYGLSVDPGFSPELISLAERGVIYAVAHVRGGGEWGPKWHEQGRMMQKLNSLEDLAASARFLTAQGYTSNSRLAVYGRSAGALTAAATALREPELFGALLLEAPFLDLIGTMSDINLPSTQREYEEWGNPAEPAAKEYMGGYSPLSAIKPQLFPITLITHGVHDKVVPINQTLKWIHMMRRLKTNAEPIMLRAGHDSAHGGQFNWHDQMADRAWQYAFLLHALGVEG